MLSSRDGADHLESRSGTAANTSSSLPVNDLDCEGNTFDLADSSRTRSSATAHNTLVVKPRHQQRLAPVSGIIHLRRIPPGMSISEIRRLLERYGRIGRVYIRKEHEHERRERIQRGGVRRKRALEAWVEFLDHRTAEQVALLLNATPMDPQNRRSRFHDDLWCLEYIPALQWHHLTDQMAATRRERILRIKNEVQASRRERDLWLERSNKARAQEAIQERRRQRHPIGQKDRESVSGVEHTPKLPPQRRVRTVDHNSEPSYRESRQSPNTRSEAVAERSPQEAALERILERIANPSSQ
ncbi:hypothetical protein CCYA_CCYA13G3549 [Cyanidiococcus yangmingshanensis]|nr:hypothetical protein CCYA_CCYA13G3549 [Cyanidiococcus yangmingshanensis]